MIRVRRVAVVVVAQAITEKIAFGGSASEGGKMSRQRRRVITIGGVDRELSPARALRFEVVRGALTGTMTIERGARRLKMPPDKLAKLVEGARRAVIAALGEGALSAAQR